MVDPAYAFGGSAGFLGLVDVTASVGLRPRELRWIACSISSKVQRWSSPYAALPTGLYAM